MILLLRTFAILIGIFLVGYVFIAALRTFVLPRSDPVKLTRVIFRLIGRVFQFLLNFLPTYEQKDALLALFAPLGLVLLVPAWLFLTTIGYALIFWGLGTTPFTAAFLLSGSSILTLGFATADTMLQTLIAFSEATVGLILVAMLISYLPTMYSAWSKREAAVTLLEVRAGIPPSAPELLWRMHGMRHTMDDQSFWVSWEAWFNDVGESHSSLSALVFFRSANANQSWVNAAGVILDAAALHITILDGPPAPLPALVIRAGNVALRNIAIFFNVPFNPDPHFPQNPIAISRADFDAACDRLAAQGVPIVANHDDAWQHFAGWRVNYDSVLVGLQTLTMAPKIPWLSEYTFVPADRSAGQTAGELRKVGE